MPGTMPPSAMRVPPSTNRADIPACATIKPGPSLARRLTRWEYDNTVRDLLGDTSAPGRGFPAEEKHLQFDNNASVLTVSPLLSEQYMVAAEQIATTVAEGDLVRFTGCDFLAMGDAACAARWLPGIARNAYRRPAAAEEIQILREVFDIGSAAGGGYKNGVKLVLMAVLQSPQFLYRIETAMPAQAGAGYARLTPHEIATRLAYLMWGAPPDGTLRTAADMNKLSMPDEITAQVTRMLTEGTAPMLVPNRKVRANLGHFHGMWFDLERLGDVEKDLKTYPKFNKSILSLMKIETDRFIEEVFFTGADLTALLSAPWTMSDDILARYYGPEVTEPAKAPMGVTPFQRVNVDPARRGGLLTQGAFLVMNANSNQSSPVHRGRFVREQLLCQPLPLPPNNVMIELPALDPMLTTRERFDKHARDPSCSVCHNLMDPIGLGFETYDGIGLFRATESGRMVDASGEIVGVPGGKFNGAVELGRKLAEQDLVKQCVVRQWFRYAYGREEDRVADACTLEMLSRKFEASGYKLKDLMIALSTTDAFLYRSTGGSP
jgi:hypothetical protein